MYPPGHVGLTAVLFAPLVGWFRSTGRERVATECLAVVTALSLLPDVDALLPGIVHRGVTHTLLAAVVVGVALSVGLHCRADSGLRLPGKGGIFCSCLGAFAIVSHLLGDIITPMGIQPLFPLWQSAHSLNVVAARSPTANALLLLAGMTALSVAYLVPVAGPPSGEDDPADGVSLGSLRHRFGL